MKGHVAPVVAMHHQFCINPQQFDLVELYIGTMHVETMSMNVFSHPGQNVRNFP